MLSPSSIAFRRTAGPLIRQLSTSTKIHRLRSFSPQTSTDTKFAIRRQVGTQEQELQVRKIDQNLLIRKFARPVEKIQLIRRVFAGKEDKQGVEVETAAEKVPQADMSEMQKIHTDKAFPVAAPYSQAIVAGGTIYVSGQIPGTADGKLVEGNIGDKTAACCKNIIAILDAAGSSIERVVKVNIFLDDMANFKEMNETYGVYFAHKPARSCVAVKALPLGVPVEIECIALAGKGSSL